MFVLVAVVGVVGWFGFGLLLSDGDDSGGGVPGGPSSSHSVSASPEGAPSPPQLPAAAREETEAGAEAFAKYYIEIDNYVFSVRDVSEARKLYDPDVCAKCASIDDNYQDLFSKGVYPHGGEYHVRDADATKVVANFYTVKVTYDRDAVQTLDKNGKQVGTSTAESKANKAVLSLIYREGRWFISNFEEG
ncbi:MAG TPA: DUF6318 family protein [Mycobacteriales bacterium]|nr:DUF6318 family protein [Mycobacteriales bacterium]